LRERLQFGIRGIAVELAIIVANCLHLGQLQIQLTRLA